VDTALAFLVPTPVPCTQIAGVDLKFMNLCHGIWILCGVSLDLYAHISEKERKEQLKI
jgi:hypothetical protein